MSWYDWLITIVPLCFVMGLGFYTRKFVVGVSDFLVGGRVCRRYVMTTAGMASAVGLITVVAYIESAYKTGFALGFWNSIIAPISILLSLSGYCMYRFRETRAMSIGQYIEMRYSRKLRIFSCFLRSIAEMVANMIMPAVAARFFIAYLDLPRKFNFLGLQIDTYLLIIIVTLVLAITLICIAGEISIMVTDTLQGLIFFPVILIFVIFILTKFSWSTEIAPVMADRAPGESFINPYDLYNLREFNLLMVRTAIIGSFLHRLTGVTGTSNAAVSAHEAKMGAILGTWRGAFTGVFYVVIAIGIITIMHHKNYAEDARQIRINISQSVVDELLPTETERADFMERIKEIPPIEHEIGKDEPYSEKTSPDNVYFDKAQEYFGLDGEGSSKTQQYRTLFRQLMLPATMRHILPPGMIGLFCMLILLFILSTDDSRIYSASATLVQDCIVPFYKSDELSPEKHIFYIRAVSIGVGIFFVIGSVFTAQLDYISLFVSITYGMWMGGCGPMLVFGIYSRFGTTIGAWCSLLSGMLINLTGLIMQRGWASSIYPWLEKHDLVEPVGNFLAAVSKPFNPIVVWEMNRLKCPINSYEFYLMAMLTSLFVYLVVSWLTCREPFNLDRLLHRGKYAEEGAICIKTPWSLKNIGAKLIGITPEYTKGDKILAWSVFGYSFIYGFCGMFLLVVIWNAFSPWPVSWWSNYFLIKFLIIPGIAALITSVWFTIGGVRDMIAMFRALKNRVANPLDNGMVEGHVSIDEKQKFDAIDKKEEDSREQ